MLDPAPLYVAIPVLSSSLVHRASAPRHVTTKRRSQMTRGSRRGLQVMHRLDPGKYLKYNESGEMSSCSVSGAGK